MKVGRISLIDIPDGKPLQAFLPISTSKTRFRVPCTFTYDEGKMFYLNFNLGVLPAQGIKQDGTALIFVDIGGMTSTIEAKIVKMISKRQLYLEMISTCTHAQLREFFRVDTVTQVIGENFHPTVEDKGETWKIQGETIDISGSGLLARFETDIPNEGQVRLQLALPQQPDKTISLIARKVRADEIEPNLWEIAFHFEDIATEDRDKIIQNCLFIQRQLLRLKVEINS